LEPPDETATLDPGHSSLIELEIIVMPYAICRVAKLKSFANVVCSQRHTDRTQETPNADPQKTQQNIELIPSEKTLEELVKAKLDGMKPRKDATLCTEMLLTASPEFFRQDLPEEWGVYNAELTQQWIEASFNFLKDNYGDNLVKATVHMDEATPHITAYIVPLYEKDGEKRLSHRKLFGGSLVERNLANLQDDYHAAVEHLGLERGIEGSKAKHKKIRQWYAEQNLNEAKQHQIWAEDTLESMKFALKMGSPTKGKDYQIHISEDAIALEALDGRGVLISKRKGEPLEVSEELTEADRDCWVNVEKTLMTSQRQVNTRLQNQLR